MNLIVFGATGGLGRHVSAAALEAGHRVTLFARSPHKLDAAVAGHANAQVVQGDVMDAQAVRAASEGAEVAINCTSPAGGNAAEAMVRSLVPASAEAGVLAFYLVGGIGALWAPGTGRTVLIQDWSDAEGMRQHGLDPRMPQAMIQNMTRGHLASMAFLERTGLPHTYLCPGRMVEGPPSAARVVTLDEIGGPSPLKVPYADIAVVIVEDLAQGRLLGHRVGVSPA